jgi:hypothetical protein
MARSSRISSRKLGAGKHHRLDLKLSAAGPDGVLDFFSDGFSCHLELKKGAVSGSTIISGRDFATRLAVTPRNLWTLEYIHEKNETAMSISASFGAVTKSANLFGVSRKDAYSDIQLSFSENLGINGHVAGKTRNLSYKLRFSKHGAAAVELEHTGAAHLLKAVYYPGGSYELSMQMTVGGGTLTVSKKKDDIQAEASFSF